VTDHVSGPEPNGPEPSPRAVVRSAVVDRLGLSEPGATLPRVAKVGVCEDDQALRSTLIRSVKAAGHEVVIARTGAEALRTFPPLAPDVVVLDIGLPDSDGRDVCLALRAGGLQAPVLFLTARDAIHDKVAGFESGADDYLTKPFELAELLVRIQALARRSMSTSVPGKGLHLDPAKHAVSLEAATVSLTPTEFRLLAKLLASPGHVVRRHALVAAGWPMGAVVHDNTLDSYVRRLRRKLKDVGAEDRSIETVRGVGYVWR
jgi:two-component system, OmpR family, response regulator